MYKHTIHIIIILIYFSLSLQGINLLYPLYETRDCVYIDVCVRVIVCI